MCHIHACLSSGSRWCAMTAQKTVIELYRTSVLDTRCDTRSDIYVRFVGILFNKSGNHLSLRFRRDASINKCFSPALPLKLSVLLSDGPTADADGRTDERTDRHLSQIYPRWLRFDLSRGGGKGLTVPQALALPVDVQDRDNLTDFIVGL